MRAQSVLLAFAFILGACVPEVAPPAIVEAVETPAALRETTPESTQAEGSERRINVRVDDIQQLQFSPIDPAGWYSSCVRSNVCSGEPGRTAR